MWHVLSHNRLLNFKIDLKKNAYNLFMQERKNLDLIYLLLKFLTYFTISITLIIVYFIILYLLGVQNLSIIILCAIIILSVGIFFVYKIDKILVSIVNPKRFREVSEEFKKRDDENDKKKVIKNEEIEKKYVENIVNDIIKEKDN